MNKVKHSVAFLKFCNQSINEEYKMQNCILEKLRNYYKNYTLIKKICLPLYNQIGRVTNSPYIVTVAD